MKTAPMAGKSWQPSHQSPHAIRGTVTRHKIETENAPSVRTPRYDPQARGIPTHAHMCRHH